MHARNPDSLHPARPIHLLARFLYLLARTRSGLGAPRGSRIESVVHISPSLFGRHGVLGGGERAAYELAMAMARELPTRLVSFGDARDSWRDGDLTIEVYPSAAHLSGQVFDPLSLRFLTQLVNADVIHCHQYRVAVSQLAIVAGRALGKRTFVTDRGGVGVHFDPQVPVQTCLSGVLAISRFSLAHLPSDAPRHLIYGGATELFRQAGPDRRAQPPPHRERRVLFVGRIMRHKGIDVLIRGLPDGVGLDVAGPVNDEQYFGLLRRLSERRDVRFLHAVTDEQLVCAYRKALVTVLPSVYEDVFGGRWAMPELLGNVLLESMACATPTICSDVGGMPEIVQDGVTGFVVPASDPAALTERIAQLAADDRLRGGMGRRARARVLERFTWDRVAARSLSAYRDPQGQPQE